VNFHRFGKENLHRRARKGPFLCSDPVNVRLKNNLGVIHRIPGNGMTKIMATTAINHQGDDGLFARPL